MYNAAATLPVAIESVLGQSLRDFEFLLLDDGSTDASLTIARAYASRDSRIRVIAMPRQGLVRSLNQLFAEARAPLVARFDADDICMAPRFEQQVAFLADHPDHGLVGCETIFIDENGVATDAKAKAPLIRPHSHEAFIAQLERGPILCHSAVMVRRDLVRGRWLSRILCPCRGLRSLAPSVGTDPDDQSARTAAGLSGERRSGQFAAHGGPGPQCRDCLAGPPCPPARRGRSDRGDDHPARHRPARCAVRTGQRGLCPPPHDRTPAVFPDHLANEAWPVLLGYIADIGPDPAFWPQLRPQLWRVALRLLRAGHPLRAAQAAMALLRHGA
jgi:hypothetical protein